MKMNFKQWVIDLFKDERGSTSVKPVIAKKTSITCVKGKTIKKVTAINPLCPKGYKKK